MSAIKRFFEKKKTDAKFKLAGSGQKLGDASSAAASGQSSSRQPTSSSSSSGAKSNRGALSHEQRLAASAALQRYLHFVKNHPVKIGLEEIEKL